MRHADALRDILADDESPQKKLLTFFMAAPEQTLTSDEATALMGYKHFFGTNGLMGRIGRAVYEKTGRLHPDDPTLKEGEFQYQSIIAFQGKRRGSSYPWRLRPQIVAALIELGFSPKDHAADMPEEIPIVDVPKFLEGKVKPVWINAYERSPEARTKCLAKHGYECSCCGVDMQQRYGLTNPFVHVHHLKPIATLGEQYLVDPVADLRPVCPNCHAVLHLSNPILSIEELRLRLSSRD